MSNQAEKRKKHADYMRAWSEKNREKVRASKRADYEKNKQSYIDRSKKSFNENRDRYREYGRVYRSRRRAIEKSGDPELFNRLFVHELLEKQRYMCPYCRVAIDSATCHIDHIMPFALGGKHVKSNIQATCPRCNLMKSSKHPAEFALRAKEIFG
jgi:5-methylcytosine-specific restriction endonuclease McrA